MKLFEKKPRPWGVLMYILFLANQSLAQNNPCLNYLEVNLFVPPNLPIADAELFIESQHLLKITNSNGQARFEKICNDSVEVDIWHQNQHLHITLKTNQSHIVAFPFSDTLRLSETHIKQHQIAIHSDHLHLESISLSSGNSISEKLALIPMIRLQRTGNSIQKPMLQGLTGLRLPIFQDGLRIQGQAWGSDHAPELGRIGAEEIRIYKGADALTSASDGWGNFIEISYRPEFHAFENQVDLIQGFQSNALQSSSGIQFKHGGNKENNGFYLSLQYQNAADYRIPMGYLPNTAFRESSIYSGFSHEFNNSIYKVDASYFSFLGGIYLGSHIGNLSDLNAAIQSSEPLILGKTPKRNFSKPYQEAAHSRISIERLPKKSNGLYIKSGYQRNQRKEFDPHRNPLNTFPQLNIWLHSLQTYIKHEWNITHQQTLIWGAQHEYRQQDWGGFFLAPAYSGNDVAAFVKLPKKTKNGLHEITVRYDKIWRNTQIKAQQIFENFAGFSGAYSGSWVRRHLKDEVHISVGRRAPSVNERFSEGVHHGSASYEQGNPTMGMELGYKIEWEHQVRYKNLSWRTNLYAMHAPNFIHLNPQAQPILSVRGAFPHYIYQALPTTYAGLNFWTAAYYDNGHFEFQGDFIWGQIWQPERYPTQLPAPNLMAKWQHQFKNITLTLQHLWVAKMPFYTEATDLMPPPAAYGLTDISFKIPNIGTKNNLSFEAGIYNVFDVSYRDYLDRFRYFTPQMGRNIQIQLALHLHHHRKHNKH